jgi:hypothetical protein
MIFMAFRNTKINQKFVVHGAIVLTLRLLKTTLKNLPPDEKNSDG